MSAVSSFVTASSFEYAPLFSGKESTMISNEELISRMQLKNGFKSFRFQIDLTPGNGEQWNDQKSYSFRTKVEPRAAILWEISIAPSKQMITMNLVGSSFPKAFAIFRLVVIDQSNQKVEILWNEVGARIFRARNHLDDIKFIDSDEDSVGQNAWKCSALSRLAFIDSENGNGLSLQIFIDLPSDYGSEEFHRLLKMPAIGFNGGLSNPYVDRAVNGIKDFCQDIRDPDCPMADVMIVVVDDIIPQPHHFYCHGLLLSIHSKVFERELKSNVGLKLTRRIGKKGNAAWSCRITGYDVVTVTAFIRYFYFGKLDLSVDDNGSDGLSKGEDPDETMINVPRLIRLTKLAAEYEVENLLVACETRLIQLCDLIDYRLAFAGLASNCNLRRLKTVLITLMAGVKSHIIQCATWSRLSESSTFFDDLLSEQERKNFLSVTKLVRGGLGELGGSGTPSLAGSGIGNNQGDDSGSGSRFGDDNGPFGFGNGNSGDESCGSGHSGGGFGGGFGGGSGDGNESSHL